MLNPEKNRLAIFENFHREYEIDLHPEDEVIKKELLQTSGLVSQGGFVGTAEGFGSGWNNTVSNTQLGGFQVGNTYIDPNGRVYNTQAQSLWQRILQVFFPQKKVDKKFDAEKFFKDVKGTFQRDNVDIEKQKERIMGMYVSAKANKQTALCEKFGQEAMRIALEMRLIQNGFPIFVDEKEVVEIAQNNSTVKLKLDWLKNFARPIPEEVAGELRKAQELALFHNYVIMHYDPDGSGTLMTAKEEQEDLQRRRDPILFGVLDCSTRLYYLGDWDDEYCDLKLTDIIGSDERIYSHVLTSAKMIDLEAQGKIEVLKKRGKKNPSVTVEEL
jgi:hypothetical protein